MLDLLSQPELVAGVKAPRCPACGGEDLLTLGSIPEAFHFCALDFCHPINCASLVECRSCDFHFKDPCLAFDVIDDMYRRQPATVWGGSGEDRQDVEQIASLLERIPGNDIGILDVGCYTGGLLHALSGRLTGQKNLLLHGIEPSKEAAAEASLRGVRILGASISDLPAHSKFDVIVLTDVFEHILASAEFLQKLCRFLSAGGYLVVVTGAYDSASFSRYRQDYYYCIMPEHLAFLSHPHARWLATRLDLQLIDYTLIFHSVHKPSRVKKQAAALLYGLLRLIPARWLSRRHPVAHQLARLREMGIPNLTCKPDHAFAVFRRTPSAVE